MCRMISPTSEIRRNSTAPEENRTAHCYKKTRRVPPRRVAKSAREISRLWRNQMKQYRAGKSRSVHFYTSAERSHIQVPDPDASDPNDSRSTWAPAKLAVIATTMKNHTAFLRLRRNARPMSEKQNGLFIIDKYLANSGPGRTMIHVKAR